MGAKVGIAVQVCLGADKTGNKYCRVEISIVMLSVVRTESGGYLWKKQDH